MLGNMENEPVIEETYREVLEDDMDIKDATEVLSMIENGKMGVDVFHFTGTPSPFAHSIILSGFSDIVLMEDRSELLKELHRKVLYRALGDSVKEFEFDEDHVIPYFRQKMGRVVSKSDIVPLLMRTGPLQAIRERGRNIYSYCDEDKKIIDEWVRELLKEGVIGTVFLDDPHIMAKSEIPVYASATIKDRDLNETDIKVLQQVGERTALSDITAALEISEDLTFRSMRKLESMYLVTRVGINANNKWYFSKADYPKLDKNKCLDEIVFRHLECFAPSTVPEVAFALSISEEEAAGALESLVKSEDVVRGQFLISQNPQYMKAIDRMRLRAGKENVFDFETVEEYRRTKGEKFNSIEDYFKFYGSAGSEIDVFNRVSGFSLEDWYRLRESERLLLGRFVRGRVRYVLSEDGDRLAALRPPEVTESDSGLLSVIEGMGHATMRQLVSVTGKDKTEIKESIQRLDRSLMIIRAFTDREDWGTENTYKLYHPRKPEKDPTEDLVRECIRSYGPIPAQALRFLVGVTADEAEIYARSAGAEIIFVGSGQSQMYVMPEEMPLITRSRNREEKVAIRSLFDPDLGAKWSELSARYGDKWIYPATKGNRVIGALEIWEMSGCIEVRSMDLDSPDLLNDVLVAMDHLMKFFNMKGVDIVRIREILGKDAAELGEDAVECLGNNGYRFVNGFYAKGDFIDRTMSEEEYLSLIFARQRISKEYKFSTVEEAVKARGYIRNDQEMVTRVAQKIPFKKILGRGELLKMSLMPGYIGYTTAEFAPLYRAAKTGDLEKDAWTLLELMRDRQPISRKEIVAGSPFSEERTLELLSELSKASAVCQDQDSFYYYVPPSSMGKEAAMKVIVRRHFKDLCMFSAEELAQFLGTRMMTVRKLLYDLEKEGYLVKGFLLKDDPTLRWIIKEDAETNPETFRETFLLNTQDNLHIYLRHMIKRECGGTECVIFDGTSIIGSFEGKVSSSGAKVENFKGSEKAYKCIKDTAKFVGVKIEEKKSSEDEDWDVSEFYIKTNPGAI
jgi:ATP-dependent Lhr-like helicase